MRQKRERRNAVAENQERSKGNREDHVFFPCGPYRRSMRSGAVFGRRGAYAAPILSCLNGPSCHGSSGIQRGMRQKGPQPCRTACGLTGLRTAPLGFCLKIGEEWFGHGFPLLRLGQGEKWKEPRAWAVRICRAVCHVGRPVNYGSGQSLPACRLLSRRICLRDFSAEGMPPEKAVRF